MKLKSYTLVLKIKEIFTKKINKFSKFLTLKILETKLTNPND